MRQSSSIFQNLVETNGKMLQYANSLLTLRAFVRAFLLRDNWTGREGALAKAYQEKLQQMPDGDLNTATSTLSCWEKLPPCIKQTA